LKESTEELMGYETELAKEHSETYELVLSSLSSLGDQVLQEVIAKAQENLYNRAIERQKKANAEAKAVQKSNQALLKSAGVGTHKKAKREAK
jgi:bifunctional DNase/RNase